MAGGANGAMGSLASGGEDLRWAQVAAVPGVAGRGAGWVEGSCVELAEITRREVGWAAWVGPGGEVVVGVQAGSRGQEGRRAGECVCVFPGMDMCGVCCALWVVWVRRVGVGWWSCWPRECV